MLYYNYSFNTQQEIYNPNINNNLHEYFTFIILPLTTSAIAYWGGSLFWFILDCYVAPNYRVTQDPIDWKLYKKTAIHVFYLQMSTTPFVLYSLIPYWKYIGMKTSFYSLFSFLNLIKLLLCPIFSDLVFYYLHRITHINIIYSKVHKLHHEWKTPCAVCAAYTTYFEYIFCNLPTFLLPVMILNLNWYAANIWFVFATISVIIDHSGYVFLNRSIHHANHHKYTNYNYGSRHLDLFYKTILYYDK